MYFDSEDGLVKNGEQAKIVYIYENSCNNKEPVQYRIRNQNNIFKDIGRMFKFKKVRLFNEEGAQYFEDDLRFIKNKTSLYASKGEEFDPHNCYGQYEIIKKLGQGGFGKVFLANHKHTGEKCAIKIIKISEVSDIDSIFVQAQILKSLKHENIVKVTNCLTLKNMEVAIIMQYLQGGQLLQYVDKKKGLDQQTSKIFCKQIVKGIMYCHQNNLIHRDLKLENIVLVNTQQKKIKIIDFGIAGVMNRLTQEDLDSGSLGYMAPECFQSYNNNLNQPNVKFDGRMDVWAIGVVLFGMLVNDLPFRGSNNHQTKQLIKKSQYKIPYEIKRTLSKQCINVIFRCLDPNPKTRIKIGELMCHPWFGDKFKLQTQNSSMITNLLNCNELIYEQPEQYINQTQKQKKHQEAEIILKQKRQNQIIQNQRTVTKSTKQSLLKGTSISANSSVHKLNIPKSRSNVPSIYRAKNQIPKSKNKQNNIKIKL